MEQLKTISSTSASGKVSEHTCNVCGVVFDRPYKLNRHTLLHQNIRIFKCGEVYCDKSYSSKSHLDRHIQTIHMKQDFIYLFRCPECLKTFSNRQNLKRHMTNKHEKSKTYTCDVCKQEFKKKHLLSTHMYDHTFIKSFTCNLCTKEFVSLSERKRHMKHHKTYNCEHCNTVFDHWTRYLAHKKMDHSVSEYTCHDCGRKFKKRDHIVHHVKIHFANYSAPKAFPCPYEGCGRVYTRNTNLRQHIKVNHLLKTYNCEICLAGLSTKARLKSHMETHTRPKKPYIPKTLETGRKIRRDAGISRFSTALKISGLLMEPEVQINEAPSTSNTILYPEPVVQSCNE